MAYIETVPEAEATGAVAEMYETDRQTIGFVPNFTLAFAARPDVYAAWRNLMVTIRGNMDLRRYELATIAAARRLRSTYCSLAHGSILLDKFLDAETLRAVVSDHHSAGLDDVDVAVMDLADKVANDATSVTQEDVDRLRSLGLTDAEILDVVLAAALRCFFSKTIDGIGVEPDAKYAQLDPELLEVLTVGRAIASA
jgi:uncharacterized peroxidase-related enzyme